MNPASVPAEPILVVLKQFAESFDSQFSKFLETVKDVPESLAEAVRYSALAPGKRLRPFLVFECCCVVGGTDAAALSAAAAIECVHAFSLIHDDLPAMDDASLRRSRPTCHVKFGEGMAVLAGDALLALAFELLSGGSAECGPQDPDAADRTVRLVHELAVATGSRGMVGGQVLDLEGEHQPAELTRVQTIHRLKTGRLLRSACRMGAVSGGGDPVQVESLDRYGLHFGNGFQIADDLLDVVAESGRTGKDTGVDERAGKQTYPACVGLEASRQAARRCVDKAVAELAMFGGEARRLRDLAAFVVERACC
ncbi:MAG: hypothetical protein GY842_20370 [bacterium]|nr:hypothetical protein [bacterium]